MKRYGIGRGNNPRSHGNRSPEATRLEKEALRAELDDRKMTEGCVDCGVTGLRAVCYDFDHLPGTDKRSGVSRMWSSRYNAAAIRREIEKCEIVCANCHRVRTEDRGIGDPRTIRIVIESPQLRLELEIPGDDE